MLDKNKAAPHTISATSMFLCLIMLQVNKKQAKN